MCGQLSIAVHIQVDFISLRGRSATNRSTDPADAECVDLDEVEMCEVPPHDDNDAQDRATALGGPTTRLSVPGSSSALGSGAKAGALQARGAASPAGAQKGTSNFLAVPRMLLSHPM